MHSMNVHIARGQSFDFGAYSSRVVSKSRNYELQGVAENCNYELFTLENHLPFGSLMPGRQYAGSQYRYGFNGMETDNEVSGEGATYTTHFRQYDSRLARWASFDPKAGLLPGISPYAHTNDNPVFGSDPRGDYCIPCITAAIGSVIGAGGAVYDIYRQDGNLDRLWDGDGKAWARVGIGAATGASVGSGYGGVAGAVSFAMGGSTLDQLVQSDWHSVDVSQVLLSGASAGIGYGIGKAAGSILLQPRNISLTTITPFSSAMSFPANQLLPVIGAEMGASSANTIGTKVIQNGLPVYSVEIMPPTTYRVNLQVEVTDIIYKQIVKDDGVVMDVFTLRYDLTVIEEGEGRVLKMDGEMLRIFEQGTELDQVRNLHLLKSEVIDKGEKISIEKDLDMRYDSE